VRLTLTDEQVALRDATERLLAARCSLDRVRVVESAGGFDRELWSAFVEMGFPTMAVGTEASLTDAQVVCEALGRALASVPLPSTIVAARMAASAPEVAAVIETGSPGVIVPDRSTPTPYLPIAGLALVARGDGWSVHDDLARVTSLQLTSGEPAGLGGDLGPGIPLGVDATTSVERGLDELRVLEATRLVGLARGALALAVEYCCERRQFDRPIGSFQALQHRLADHATVVDAAWLVAFHAGWALSAGTARPGDAGAAYRWCARVAREVAADAVQLHGGYGFTLEYAPQLYLRRSRGWGSWLGDERVDWATAAEQRLAGGPTPAVVGGGDGAGEPRPGVDFSLPPAAVAFRAEVSAFLREHMTSDVHRRMDESGTFHDEGFHRALAARGWIGLAWPRPEGASARSPFETAVFADEAGYAGAPVDGLQTSNIVAQVLLRVGTADQRERVVEEIRRGETLVCLGFTEPEAGSDVAAARTRAVRDGDDWVIDGSKMFTTLAHVSDHVFLLTRTNPDVPKHRGLTTFLVPLDALGVEIRAVATLGGERTNATFYDAVRVPDSCRVGDVDRGWEVMALALDVERAGADYCAQARRVLDETLTWGADSEAGRAALADPEVRGELARLTEDLRAAELAAWRVVALVDVGAPINVEASMAKLLGAVVFQRICERCLDVLGGSGIVRGGTDRSASWIEAAWRHSKVTSIYGGTNEVQRNIIARRGLGLPRER
jgi:alkylation response protein AidB-like acyl-CoA dehydrogenase